MRRSSPPPNPSNPRSDAAPFRADADHAADLHGAGAQRKRERGERTPEVRTPHLARAECTHLDAAVASRRNEEGDPNLRTAHACRTEASVRSGEAQSRWASMPKSQRPLGKARDDVRTFFDALLSGHWSESDKETTNESVASRCGVDEHVVRNWRTGLKPLPAAALLVMPPSLAAKTIAWMQDRIAATVHRRGVQVLEDALARLEEPVSDADRREVLRALIDAQRRISDRIAKLAQEGR